MGHPTSDPLETWNPDDASLVDWTGMNDGHLAVVDLGRHRHHRAHRVYLPTASGSFCDKGCAGCCREGCGGKGGSREGGCGEGCRAGGGGGCGGGGCGDKGCGGEGGGGEGGGG
eukprot:6995722-Prymnesium_polylepis.1